MADTKDQVVLCVLCAMHPTWMIYNNLHNAWRYYYKPAPLFFYILVFEFCTYVALSPDFSPLTFGYMLWDVRTINKDDAYDSNLTSHIEPHGKRIQINHRPQNRRRNQELHRTTHSNKEEELTEQWATTTIKQIEQFNDLKLDCTRAITELLKWTLIMYAICLGWAEFHEACISCTTCSSSRLMYPMKDEIWTGSGRMWATYIQTISHCKSTCILNMDKMKAICPQTPYKRRSP